jgi:hypothetical protein
MSLYEAGAKKLVQADDIPEGAVRHIGEVLQLKQVGYRDRIAVRRATDDELRFFGLREDAGIPMMVLLRTAYGVNGDANKPFPFRFTESVFPGDRNQFIINAGEVPDRLAGPAEV